ncbi:MAG: hypothetical protein QME81_07300 [bacterium]|nr:hypothetical protein [bacterium]
MAEHYHCFVDPSRVAHPKDKGKVERDVQTVREQFRKLLTLSPDLNIQKANQLIKKWCIEEYGQRDHGTTHLKRVQILSATINKSALFTPKFLQINRVI